MLDAATAPDTTNAALPVEPTRRWPAATQTESLLFDLIQEWRQIERMDFRLRKLTERHSTEVPNKKSPSHPLARSPFDGAFNELNKIESAIEWEIEKLRADTAVGAMLHLQFMVESNVGGEIDGLSDDAKAALRSIGHYLSAATMMKAPKVY